MANWPKHVVINMKVQIKIYLLYLAESRQHFVVFFNRSIVIEVYANTKLFLKKTTTILNLPYNLNPYTSFSIAPLNYTLG